MTLGVVVQEVVMVAISREQLELITVMEVILSDMKVKVVIIIVVEHLVQ